MPDTLLIDVMQANLASLRKRIAKLDDDLTWATPEEAAWLESDIDALERKETAMSRRIVELLEVA